MNIKSLIQRVMPKKKTSVKKDSEKVSVKKSVVSKVVDAVSSVVSPFVDTTKVDLFKEYLKIENPLWFKQIAYSCNTVIDHYRAKHLNGLELSKPEYRQFLQALSECDSNFK